MDLDRRSLPIVNINIFHGQIGGVEEPLNRIGDCYFWSRLEMTWGKLLFLTSIFTEEASTSAFLLLTDFMSAPVRFVAISPSKLHFDGAIRMDLEKIRVAFKPSNSILGHPLYDNFRQNSNPVLLVSLI